jgi:hypothetical protein
MGATLGVVVRNRLVALAVLALGGALAGGLALARPAFRPGRVPVAPASGSRATVFVVSFKAPERTGAFGATERHDLLTASAPGGSHGCIANVDVRAADARKGQRVRVRLAPSRLGGHWCAGVYRGEIQEIESAVCPQHRLCPGWAVLRGIVGRFAFRVNSAGPGPDGSPTVFAGLRRAFACTPGPQRPGQTTPYTLTWQPATDEQTASSQIVYDVYYATRPGGEDFASPTWVTQPGVTSFRTPGLPSHGAAYFVVRARDRAGREDRNRVEKPGIDPCY